MAITDTFDVAVIGGGVMGCTTALWLARGGMRTALVERGGLCMAASGVNAGTLSMQHYREPSLVALGLEGRALWMSADRWLGRDVGYEQRGGFILAFTDKEAETLTRLTEQRRTAGADVELMTPDRARELEPALSTHPLLASWCPLDGHANASLTGRAYRHALAEARVRLWEDMPATGIVGDGSGFVVSAHDLTIKARRIVLAGGVWLGRMLCWLGLDVVEGCRPQQMVVTERLPPFLRPILGIINGRLSVKQVANGSVLIGGGWTGEGDPERGGYGIIPSSLVGNVRLARHAVPGIGDARIVRTWLGLRDTVTDYKPIAGPVPGVPGAFVIGCGISGYTVGPVLGQWLADFLLERDRDMAAYDPARLLSAPVDP